MNKAEARAVAAARVRELRAVPLGELTRRLAGRQETEDVIAPSGVLYQIEVQGFWEGEDFRVVVSVDDRGWRAFAPLSDDFIVAPDGSFVGE